MALFRVLLRGENYLLNLSGDPHRYGFRVTHFVRAESAEEAQRVASIQVRKSQHLNKTLVNTAENPPQLTCVEVRRVWFRRARDDGRFSFWRMDDPDTE